MTSAPILVTGGTGRLGKHVVRHLLDHGRPVRVASRREAPPGSVPYEWATVDYRRGDGLTAAIEGASAVVHCATGLVRGEVRLAESVVSAAKAAECPHLIYISIVGVDRHPLGYYRAKHTAEQVVSGSGLGWTVLRATQFHDLVLRIVSALARPPVLVAPKALRLQPVDAGEVGARLAALAEDEPAGRVPDFGGPEVHEFTDLARAYLSAAGRRRRILTVPPVGGSFRAFRDGVHLAPAHTDGTVTFSEFLAQRL
ncbi:SDR family oxidoreductase [Prauserella cavernicola]|uniref:SDR family oxidoreductase n=1 Tax=Prauserella cavernicola TaxID=2800127 RepID=A0A934QXL0_9PSEU|nr:SDR family oxidoreductase [Prauserella cavernicola]MBK1788341.1 SDR family oxidoreductase [Prauserella cavernicola]